MKNIYKMNFSEDDFNLDEFLKQMREHLYRRADPQVEIIFQATLNLESEKNFKKRLENLLDTRDKLGYSMSPRALTYWNRYLRYFHLKL